MKSTYLLVVGWLLIVTACQSPQVEPTHHAAIVSTFLAYPPQVKSLQSLVVDAADNLYFSDYYGNCIWKVTPDGQLSVFAGNGQAGHQDGTGSQAQIYAPQGLTFDATGNLWVSQFTAIRKITPAGMVSTVYGVGVGGIHSSLPAPYDTTQYLVVEGSQLFENPTALVFDRQGNLFISEATNNARILKITPDSKVSVFFGCPFYNQSSTANNNQKLGNPKGLLFDARGNLIITDSGLYSSLIRIDSKGNGSYFSATGYLNIPVAGITQAPFIQTNGYSSVQGAVFDRSANLLVCNDNYIQEVTSTGSINVLAGTGKHHYVINGKLEPDDNGFGDQVRLFNAISPVIDSKGSLYFLEQAGIRKLTYQ